MTAEQNVTAEQTVTLDAEASGPWRWAGPAAALAAILWLLAPSVAWYDSGELAAAARSLGVAHPTGFPVFALAGHLLGNLPFASGALRVHLLGAICAVGAVVLWRRSLGVVWPRTLWQAAAEGLACVLPLGVGALALHVRAAEVYPPTWLVAAATLWAWHLPGRRGPLLAVLAGLGGGIHVEAAALPAMAWLAASWQAHRHAEASTGWCRKTGVEAALGAAALLTICYLPLAASRQPLFSWGDVRSMPALLDHLTAASIRAAFAGQIGHAGDGAEALAHLLWRDGRWLLGPALVGLALQWRSARPGVGPTVALVTADAAYSAIVNPMGLADDQAGLIVLLGLSVLAARGLEQLGSLLPSGRWLAAGAALVLTGTGLGARTPGWGQRDLHAGARWADQLLRRAGPGQLSVTASDHAASACIWLQAGEGARPDSPCIPGVFLRDDRMTAQQSRVWGRPAWAAGIGLAPGPGRLQAWLGPEVAVMPVRWEGGLAAEDAALGPALTPGLPWGEVGSSASAAKLETPAKVAARLCDEAGGDAKCLDAPTLGGALASALAVQAARAAPSDPADAVRLAEAAVELHATPKSLNNLANLVVNQDPRRALGLAERALGLQPDYLRAHRTAARAAAILGDPGALQRHLEDALRQPTEERRQWLAGVTQEAAQGTRAILKAASETPDPR